MPAEPRTDSDAPRATVVIPARNEEQWLPSCLDSVLAQTEQAIQVIVVDGASTDRTAEIVKEYAARDHRVELLHNPKGIIPVSLNVALEHANAPWLVRVDAHASVPPGYVAKAVEHLETGRWGGVGGRKDGVGISPAGKAIAAAMASPFGVGGSAYHHATSVKTVDHIPFGAYPVALARELGGWNEEFTVNQDFEFDWRVRAAGHELLFDPELRIDWVCRQSVGDLYRQYRRYGRGRVRTVQHHPTSMLPRHLVPPALVVYLAGAALLALRRPRLGLGAGLAYAAGVAFASAATAGEVEPEARRYLPGAFVAMHVGWGVGFWRGLAAALIGRSPT